MAIRIGITNAEYSKAREVFEAENEFECIPVPEDEAEIAQAIVKNDIKHVIIGVFTYQDELYRSLQKGSVIARFGVGHDGVNKELASSMGIFCTNTPGTLDNAVAEYTVSLLLLAARPTVDLATQFKMGFWQSVVGFELKGKKLAVIGCGPIGKKVARIASFGLQMNVTGCDILELDSEMMKREFGFDHITKDFGEAVYGADFISLHIPNSKVNYHFLNGEKLSMLPRHSWLINTARGALIDENALYVALYQKKIAGAVLDVFEREPYEPSGSVDLRTLENIIMLPHLGSSTKEACDEMAARCLKNIYYAEKNEYERMDLLNKACSFSTLKTGN